MKYKLIFLTFLTIFSVITTPIIKNGTLNAVSNADFITYRVQKGDSLWAIAIKHDSNNIENFLIVTRKLNNLQNSAIYEDQILIIP